MLDIWTVDKATRKQLNRLWLTMLIDAYTRSILGFALLFESPCIESIQRALLHAIWPKDSHLKLGLTGDWPVFGGPLLLMLDNAWAHHSSSLEQLAAGLSQGGEYDSMSLDFRVPYMGRRGALIERLFGSINRRMRGDLDGAILKATPKGVGAARKDARLLYEDLYKYIHRYILEYQSSPHDGLGGASPNEAWYSSVKVRLPQVPPLTLDMRRQFLRRTPLGSGRVIGTRGISFEGLTYWDTGLSRLPQFGQDNNRVRYEIGYDPTDISRISLFLEGRWLIDLKAKERKRAGGSLRPLSIAEKGLAMQLALRADGSARDWLEHAEEAEEINAIRGKEKRRAYATAAHPNPGALDDARPEPEPQPLPDATAGHGKRTRRTARAAQNPRGIDSAADAEATELISEWLAG